MTQVGSGNYAAPEINKEDSIYIEYDLKIDVYSLGITFCTLAFFEMEIPKDPEKIQKLGYSQELYNIINLMITSAPSKRPSSLQAYNNFIKFYVEKYVHNTGLMSCIQCLFASPSIYNFLCHNNYPKETLSKMPIFEKFYEIFLETYFPQKNLPLSSTFLNS